MVKMNGLSGPEGLMASDAMLPILSGRSSLLVNPSLLAFGEYDG